jgi:hypothetical protein
LNASGSSVRHQGTGLNQIGEFRIRFVGLVLGLLLLGGSLLCAGAQASAPTPKNPKHALSKKQRAELRKKLLRQVRRDPASALSRSFLRKAALAEFQLPMTVRLSASDGQGGYRPSDDLLEIDWDDSVFAWPLSAGLPSGNQSVAISGNFTMDAIFGGGDTSGYGELGAIETVLGRQISMSSGPFVISDFAATCPDGPQLAADANTRGTVTSTQARYGLMNPFSQTIRGTLALRMSFPSSIAATCGATPGVSAVPDNSSANPMPVRFDGKFSISPAITPDGKLRFGKITVDDATNAQDSTFAFVRACTQPTSDPSTCDPQLFPARIKFKTLSAEVLLGDVVPR